MDKYIEEGREASQHNYLVQVSRVKRSDFWTNPYPKDSQEHQWWHDGYTARDWEIHIERRWTLLKVRSVRKMFVDEIELKPCQCGSTEFFFNLDLDRDDMPRNVVCKRCEAVGPYFDGPSESPVTAMRGAAKLWNER